MKVSFVAGFGPITRGRTRTETDIAQWRAARGTAGRLPPLGFPRSNRF